MGAAPFLISLDRSGDLIASSAVAHSRIIHNVHRSEGQVSHSIDDDQASNPTTIVTMD